MKTEIAPLLDHHQARAVRLRRARRRSPSCMLVVVVRRCCSRINLLAGVERATASRSDVADCRPRRDRAAPARATEPAAVRRLLIARRARVPRRSSCVVPLAVVFVEALREGLGGLLATRCREPDALARDPADARSPPRSPCRSTSSSASRRRGRSRKFRLPGQEPPDHADRPAVRRLAGRSRGWSSCCSSAAQGWFGPWLADARHQDHLRRARDRARDALRHLPVRRARADPADGGAGHARRRRRRVVLGASGWQIVLARDAAEHQVGPALRRRSSATPARWASSARCRSSRATSAAQTNTMPLHVEILYNEYDFAARLRRRVAAGAAGARHARRQERRRVARRAASCDGRALSRHGRTSA